MLQRVHPRRTDDASHLMDMGVGSAAWTFDAIVNLYYHDRPHAELAFMVAVMFGIAWAYYCQQPKSQQKGPTEPSLSTH